MFLLTLSAQAQNEKCVKKAEDDVELVCAGDGKTIDEAVKMALRSGLEQTYGTFVSSNTTILNDDLIKDEIVSLSTGNVKGYEIVSKNQSSDGTWNAVVKAVFSTGKLVSYVKSKGGSTELAGGLFAMYAKMEKMNEEAEIKVISNLRTQLNLILPLVYDYSVTAESPQKNSYGDGYYVDGTIECRLNENAKKLKEVFTNTLQSIALTPNEVVERKNAGLPIYPVAARHEKFLNGERTDLVYGQYNIRGKKDIGVRVESIDIARIIKESTSASQFESFLDKFFFYRGSGYLAIYFLRTNALSGLVESLESPVRFILSDGICSIYGFENKESGPARNGSLFRFRNFIGGVDGLLIMDNKKRTLACTYNGRLFTYKNIDELSKVSKITITPIRDIPK